MTLSNPSLCHDQRFARANHLPKQFVALLRRLVHRHRAVVIKTLAGFDSQLTLLDVGKQGSGREVDRSIDEYVVLEILGAEVQAGAVNPMHNVQDRKSGVEGKR